jgi:isoaspartyl peptidase/L-asparaginase-like protein (Ntn-hydrolase superfamily)
MNTQYPRCRPGGAIAVTRTGEIAMRYNSQGMKRACVGSDRALFVKTFD